MTAHQGQIPGLYGSDKNVDWSSDSMAQDRVTTDNPNVDNTSQGQNNNMMLLRSGKNSMTDLLREKDILGSNFVHSHRLLEAGEIPGLINAHQHVLKLGSILTYFLLCCLEICKLQHGGTVDLSSADPDTRQCEKIYVSLKDQKQVKFSNSLCGYYS